MQYSKNFTQSFEKNSKKIIEEYNVDNNNISIEHINFIVIGSAGVGKSAFINETLLLEGNKKSKEGKGESQTLESKLYTSDKLKMIRMWDTPGVDFKRTQENILNEIQNIVNKGLEDGPDHYINIILYCIKGDRFQEEEGNLVYQIMQLYPFDNLPVIITQLQAYSDEDVKTMETTIKEILTKYLDIDIVKKIEIKDVVSRDKKFNQNNIIKARGIPKLLKCSFDIMGRAIASATFKKFSEDIGNLCKKYIDDQLNYMNQICKDEIELLEKSKKLENEEENDLDNDNNQKVKLNKLQKRYSKSLYELKEKEKLYFYENFIKILKSKIQDIYNNLNKPKTNSNDKSNVLILLEEKLKMIKGILETISKKIFQEFNKSEFKDYYNELLFQQSKLNSEYDTNIQIEADKVKEEFRKELFDCFTNEFFKIFLCIIINLFKNNLKKILFNKYQDYITEKKKIISEKAENSLKNITMKLKEKLLIELDKYFPEKPPVIQRTNTESSENSLLNNLKNLDEEFKFDY